PGRPVDLQRAYSWYFKRNPAGSPSFSHGGRSGNRPDLRSARKVSHMSRIHNPAHPGEVLREYLPEGLAVTEAAKRLGVTRQALSVLLNGRAAVSAEMALRLEAALGTSAEMWLEMQAGYDLWQARQHGRPKVERIA